ncbi:MAG: glycoside hydrolase family 43 protein [Lachnospiraceae bacterium]|nr:glycoside hydrolase family 43 protein [Lachnospiraceae bacterium]
MRYTNPIVKGFYPDPSVCEADGIFYLACSSFQYFPGVPLFQSTDLVNWTQIGHALTRKSQVMLDKVNSSGGVFAPTLRFHEGRFYMVTNNNTTQENFYVYTDDIHGEWSGPITVDQGGIDPSLLFDDGHVYFISNGADEHGVGSVIQCEIDIRTGRKLTPSKPIWQGSGGRYLESPHMYHIGDTYYLVAAKGGTEYGHMVTYAVSDNAWGPFRNYPHNPVLTNRNKAPGIIQGIGHGDLIRTADGAWFLLTLGFRQIHKWQPYHHLGREVFLTPVFFDKDGWFHAGADGTTEHSYEIDGDFPQLYKNLYTFENTSWDLDWIYLRHPHMNNYTLENNRLTLRGSDITLDVADSPTFLGIRQRDFDMTVSVNVEYKPSVISDSSATMTQGEAGLTLYMDELQHYDIYVTNSDSGYEAVLKLNIGNIKHMQTIVPLENRTTRLVIESDSLEYHFYLVSGAENPQKIKLGSAYTKYLSSEVAGGFTGVVIGLYAVGECTAVFDDFSCEYHNPA